jgi:vacuolar protein sorting-associated protein 54
MSFFPCEVAFCDGDPAFLCLLMGTVFYECSGLILLKMIAEYMDISNALPSLATEVVHRVAEILKLYNSRSCQLVLGAGAMQVSLLISTYETCLVPLFFVTV